MFTLKVDFKPKAALGYPSSLFTIASWLIENNDQLDIPLSFTSSESLLAFQEEKIKLAFNTKMFDWYGNAERTISLYREEGKYYEPFLYSINEYAQNNVITTSLINNYFPLIRYEVNDRIVASNNFNDQRKSIVINSIEGRVEDYIVLPDGSKIGRLDVVFKGVKNIKFAQIIQENKNGIIVNIVRGSEYNLRDEKKLIENFALKVGGTFKVDIRFIEKQDFTAVAKQHIDTLYAYDISPVLFKPTKAAKDQFRGTKETALSYFVATNGACSEDKGFAIQPWTKVRFENTDIITTNNSALAMGNYYFTNTEGSEVKVEYTFGYILDPDQNLRINVHHSSIPYSG